MTPAASDYRILDIAPDVFATTHYSSVANSVRMVSSTITILNPSQAVFGRFARQWAATKL